MKMKLLTQRLKKLIIQIEDEGYITTLNLIGVGRIATASAGIGSGYVRRMILNNDGYGYTSPPTVSIGTAPSGGVRATAEVVYSI